jgi:hypothetical protein
MPADPPPATVHRRRAARTRGHAPRAILNAIMTLAVIVLERRIRKALHSGAQAGPGPDRGGRS